MKRISLLLILLVFTRGLYAQTPGIDSIRFFTDEQLIDMSLTTDIKKLQAETKTDVFQEATISLQMPDSSKIDETISLAPRGHFRRDFCEIPPILLNFHNPAAPVLNQLGKLKLVIGCGTSSENEQLLLKEYLIYKIYNLLEPKSFRVRLLRVTYHDSRNKIRSFTQYAFLIEDDADMARRNGCEKKDKMMLATENTNRQMMTFVAVFEYLISNTDWSVPNNHNIKLIFDKKDPAAPPFPVAYDFDHSGLVNAGYAVPNEVIGTESVTERVYRGFPRTMGELAVVFEVFNQKKTAIYSLIQNFKLIKDRTRTEMISYIDEFYETINSPSRAKNVFIENARKN